MAYCVEKIIMQFHADEKHFPPSYPLGAIDQKLSASDLVTALL